MSAQSAAESNDAASLFALLDAVESKYPLHFSYFGQLVEAVQILSFACTVYSAHGEILTALAPIFYAVQMPVYDQNKFFVLDAANAAGFLWAFAALSFLFVAVTLLFAVMGFVVVRKKSSIYILPRALIHLITTILFIPILHVFTAYAACDATNHLWTFSGNTACFTSSHSAQFAGAIVGGTCLLTLTLVCQSTLTELDSLSPRPLARVNVVPSVIFTLWKAMTVVLFHVLIARGHVQWFAVYVACSATVMAGMFMFTLPFYSQRTNARYAGLMVVVAGVAVVSAISHDTGAGTMITMDIDAALVLGLAGPFLAAGMTMAHYRINPDYKKGLPTLMDLGERAEARPTFPLNLPVHDQSHPLFRSIIADVMDQPPADDGSESFALLVPFLESVWIPSDIEVAARFLDHFTAITKIGPGLKMLVLGARLYTKGKTKFYGNDSVCVAFANMLFSHAGKPRCGLMELDWMLEKTQPSLANRYHAHRLSNAMKSELNLRDASYQRVCTGAKKAYRDALEQVVVFWTRLTADQQDFAALYTVASLISARRATALEQFHRAFAINPNDRANASRYAVFVDHILMESERAEGIQAALQAEAEERKWSAMRGARKGGRTAANSFDITPFLEEAEADESKDSSRIYTTMSLAASMLLLLAVVGDVIFAIVEGITHLLHLDGIFAYSSVAALAAHSAVVASVMVSNITNPSDASVALLASATDLRTTQNAVTFGKYAPTTSAQVEYFKSLTTVQASLDVSSVFQVNATTTTTLTVQTFVDLAYNYVDGLLRQMTFASSQVSAASPVATLLTDAELHVATAFNRAVRLEEQAIESVTTTGLAVYFSLFALSLVLVVSVVTVAMANSSRVSAFRVSILSLFVLVPRKIVRTLLEIAQSRLARVDADDGDTMQQAEERQNENADDEDDAENAPLTGGEQQQQKKSKSALDDETDEATTVTHREDLGVVLARAVAPHVVLFSAVLLFALISVSACAAFEVMGDDHNTVRHNLASQHDALVDKYLKVLRFEQLVNRRLTVYDSHSANDDVQLGLLSDQLQSAAADELAYDSVFAFAPQTRVVGASFAESTVWSDATSGLADDKKIQRQATPGAQLVRDAAAAVDTFLSGYLTDLSAAPSARLLLFANHTVTVGATTTAGEAARLDCFGTAAEARRGVVRDAIALQIDRVQFFTDQHENSPSRWAPLMVAIIAAVAQFVVLLGAVVVSRKSIIENTGSVPLTAIFIASVLLLTSLAPIATIAGAVNREIAAVRRSVDLHRSIDDRNHTIATLIEAQHAAGRFPHSKDLRAYRFYWDRMLFLGSELSVLTPDIEATALLFKETDDQGVTMSNSVSQLLFRAVITLRRGFGNTDTSVQSAFFVTPANVSQLIAATRSAERVALALTASSARIPRIYVREVADATWDVTTEPDLAQAIDLMPYDPLRYTNSSYDRSRGTADQLNVARYALFSTRYSELANNLTAALNFYYTAGVSASALVDVDDDETTVRDLIRVGIACGASIAIASMLVGVVVVRAKLFARSTYTGVRAVRASDEMTMVPTGIGSRAVPLVAASILVAISLIAFVAVAGRSETGAVESAKHISAVATLQEEAALAVITARRYALGVVSPLSAQQTLLRRAVRVEEAWNALLFGNKQGLAVAAATSTVDAILFNQRAATLPYACGYAPQSSNTTFASLSSAVSRLVLLVRQAADSNPGVDATAAADALAIAYFPLFHTGRELHDAVLSNERTQRTQWMAAIIGIGCGSILIMLASYFLVVHPLLKSLDSEYADATLMLRMMPQNVRDNVPAVAEFIQHTLAGAAGSQHVADISYSAPIIVIDDRGTVLKFNSAAEECFGYDASEVTGNNVKMLMNDHDRQFHDEYLTNYKRTGIRKVIGYERVVTAKRKSGELFPLALNVKSLARANGETVYIAFLADVTRRADLTRMEELNDIVQELASVPIIAIDALGTVTRFNRAAERLWGHAASDVVGQNVKMLMPESIAKHHDAYLANYLRTGVKNVIDTIRRLTGVTKAGEEFTFELAVKEIVGDAGTQSTYLGFAKDLTSTLLLEEKNRINDEIAALSPISIIGIDCFGMVLKFNRAAEALFGYTSQEVVGQNVKMLMPQSIATNHDEYLQNYRKTGKKNVIGGEREVFGLRKDKVEVPLRIFVGEAKQEGMRPIFLGYLVDIRQELRDLRSSALDDAVRGMATFPIVTMNATGVIRSVNQALLVEFGYTEDELMGENIKMLMTPEIAVQHDEYLRRYQMTKIRSVIGNQRRLPAKRKNGVRIMVEIRVDETTDSEGNSIFIGFLRNINAELELEQQFSINSIIQDLSLVPMIAIDAQGTILRFSRAAEETWARPSSEVVGKNVKLLMPEFFAVQHDQYLKNYVQHGQKHVIGTTRYVEAERRDGTIFPAVISVLEVEDPSHDRTKSLFVGYVRDVTTDGEADQMLRRNEVITNLSPISLIQTDRYGIVSQFNPAAELEFGYTRDEVVGRNVKMLLPDDLARNHDAWLSNYRRTRKRNVIGTLRRAHARRKNGTIFPVEIAVSEIIMDGDEEHSFYSAYVRNIAEFMELELTNTVSGVISDLSPIPLIAITDRGMVLKINAAGANRFGYKVEDVIGKNVKMLMPESIAKKHDGYLSAYIKTGEKRIIDSTRVVQALTSSGELFTAEVGVRELITETGGEQTRMFWGFLRDCTEDIKRDRGLKLAEAVLERSTVALMQIDHVGTILGANRATTATFGYATSELLGQNVKKLMPFNIAMRHDGYLERYMRTKEKHVIDTTRQVEGQTKDGRQFPLQISVREVTRNDGRPPVFVAYLIDETEKMLREKTSALTNATKDSCPAPLVVIDEEGFIMEFNSAAEEMWQYTTKEVLGQNVKMLMPEEIAEQHDGFLSTYKSTGVRHVVGTTRMVQARKKGGDRCPVRLTIRETILPGDRKRFVAFIEDQSHTFASLKSAVVGEQIIAMLPIGVICIDELGIVRVFNPTAEKLWGFTSAEVVGKNVKMLMPDGIAARHDSILMTYKITKKRNVVGTTRTVDAKLKNGTIASFELDVREYSVDGNTRFCAYIRDNRGAQQAADDSMMSKSMVDLSLDMIVMMDSVGTITDINKSALFGFGYSANSEVVGGNIKMLMPEEIAVNHDAYLQRYVDTGVKKVIDGITKNFARRKNGDIFPVELRIREIPGRTRAQSTFVGFLRDRTKELVLEANAVVCDAIEELMPDGLIVMTDIGTVLTFTLRVQQAFGYTKEEVVGQNIKMLMPQEIARNHDGYLRTYRETGVKHVVDTTRRVTGRRKNGTEFEVEIRVAEYKTSTEQFFIGFVRDCSNEYEEVVARSLTNTLFEVTPEAMIAIDKVGTVVNFNKAAELLFDFDRTQVVGRNVKILMPDKHALRHDQYLAQYQRHKIKRVVDNVRVVEAEKKSGETFQAEISVRETTDVNGDPLFVGYLRDVNAMSASRP